MIWNPFIKRPRHPRVALTVPEKVDASSFDRLFRLALKHKWLEGPSAALVELWNLCDTSAQQTLLESLLSNVCFVDSAGLDEYGEAVAALILDTWKLPGSSTLISATCNNTESDGSQAFLQSLKNKFSHVASWQENSFYNSIAVSVNAVENNSNVVLLDDFIGTGNTISRRLTWYRNKVADRGVVGVKYFVVGLAAMEAAKSQLDDLGVPYEAAMWLGKGITDYLAGAKVKEAKADMKALENKLEEEWKGRKLSLFSFGYGKSEALFYLESFNVPNNVFPIFWWPPLKKNGSRNVLFRRLSP